MDLSVNPVLFYILYIWSIVWKGLALWRAARSGQRNWFIAMLVINLLGILEIVYLLFFAKDKLRLSDLMPKKK
jgi:methionyl-tRNA synthetase